MNPNVLELSISTPQPRLNEIFYLNLDISDLKAAFFGALATEIKPTTEVVKVKNGMTTIKVSSHTESEQYFSIIKIANKTGKFEAGPLMFELNGIKYTTNKIRYEIVDLLPNTDKGIWFRKVIFNKKSFCIIIEQRIPIGKMLKIKDDPMVAANEVHEFPFAKFKTIYLNPIIGLKSEESQFATGTDKLITGRKTKSFAYSYSTTYFNITNLKTKIKLTKENFENIPGDYEFEDIVIQ